MKIKTDFILTDVFWVMFLIIMWQNVKFEYPRYLRGNYNSYKAYIISAVPA